MQYNKAEYWSRFHAHLYLALRLKDGDLNYIFRYSPCNESADGSSSVTGEKYKCLTSKTDSPS